MASIDAGSISSSIRIELDKLSADARKVEVIYDNLEKSTTKSVGEMENQIKNVSKVQKQGALTQQEAIKRVIAIRKEELDLIKKSVIDKGKASDEQIKDIQKLEKEIEDLNKTQKEGVNVTKDQSKSFKDLAADIGFVTIAVTTAKKAIDVFAKTEQSLANVRAVTGSTSEEFEKLEIAALKAGETTRFSASQSADALFFLASAGLDATESAAALQTTLELAGATQSDLAFTARTLTATLAQFNIEADDASRVSNVFAAANANSQATTEKLADALKQTGSVANLLGISLEETVGSLQLLFNAGFQGEAAGRALKSALADLGNESSITNKKLSELGISFDQVNPKTVGLTGAIANLEDAGLDAAQILDAFGKVAGPQIAQLISQGEDEILKYTKAVTDTNAAAEQYRIQNDTLAGSLDKLKSAAENSAIIFTRDFSPVIRAVIDTLAGLLKIITSLPDFLRNSGIAATGASIGFLALVKALGALGIVISSGPLAIVAGLGAVIGLMATFINRSEKIKQQKLKDEFGGLAESLGKTGAELDDFTKKSGKIESSFKKLEDSAKRFNAELTDKTVELQIKNLAKSFNLTEKEVVRIALESKKVSRELKEQLKVQEKQIKRLEIQRDIANRLTSAERGRLEAKREQEKLEREELERKQEILKAEEDRDKRLRSIQSQIETLDELNKRGALSEIDLLNQKKELREEEISLLQEQATTSGEVSDQIVSDILTQEKQVERYQKRIEELEQQQKDLEAAEKNASKENQESYKTRINLVNEYLKQGLVPEQEALKEKIKISQDEINKLKERSKEEGSLSQEIIENIQTQLGFLNDYENQLEDVKEKLKEIESPTLVEEIQIQLEAEIKPIVGELLSTLSDILSNAVSVANDKVSELASSLEQLIGVEEDRLERIAEIQSEISELQKERFKEQKRLEKEALEDKIGLINNELRATKSANDDKIDLIKKEEKAAIKAINARLASQLSQIDKEEKETLKTLGLEEKTKLQKLKERLSLETNEEERAELEREIKKEEIREEFDQKRIDAEQAAEEEIRRQEELSQQLRIDAENEYQRILEERNLEKVELLKKIENIDEDRLTRLEEINNKIKDLQTEQSELQQQNFEDEIKRLEEEKAVAEDTAFALELFKNQIIGLGEAALKYIEGDYLGAITTALTTLLAPALTSLSESLINNLSPDVIETGKRIGVLASRIGEKLGPVIADLLEILAPFLELLFVLLDLVTDFLPLIRLLLIPLRVLSNIVELLNPVLEKLGKLFKPVTDFFDSLLDFIESILNFELPSVSDVGDFFGDPLKGVSDFVKDVGKDIKNLLGFETGGIVMASPGGNGQVVRVAENGYNETLYNEGPSGQDHTRQMAEYIAGALGNLGILNNGGGNFTIQLIQDGQMVAENTASYFNNGIVKVELN